MFCYNIIGWCEVKSYVYIVYIPKKKLFTHIFSVMFPLGLEKFQINYAQQNNWINPYFDEFFSSAHFSFTPLHFECIYLSLSSLAACCFLPFVSILSLFGIDCISLSLSLSLSFSLSPSLSLPHTHTHTHTHCLLLLVESVIGPMYDADKHVNIVSSIAYHVIFL
ncbi:hypothetical protein EGW08_007416 [Elysia chlorotica]|uniref:Uncharacterized protein n=1 Tax=Elysia chlorotica TaxID=188477 RepID=A0A3S1BIV7_ELYCH|nr:hypothetical protein EGW08_007416 [Elysia chlorotica]